MAVYTTIDDAGSFFSPKLYTGDGSTQAITGVGFQPDMVWGKQRTDAGANWFVFDAVRGATKFIESDTNAVESTEATSLTAFDADGFSLGAFAQSNENLKTMVSWNWKMGTTSGIGGSPSTTPTAYSFNATAGQSAIQYTGTSVAGGGPTATLPHGLGVAPAFIILKNYTAASRDWYVYHQYLGNTQRIYLNQNTAATTSSTAWNDTSPTSTLFTVGTNEAVNENTSNLIAYCFAEKQGYSKFSSYTGNGNADGPMIYTGFRPAWILTKKTTATVDWWVFDDKRIGYNPNQYRLLANTSSAETSVGYVDFLSNGFKWRSSDGDINGSGDVFVYAAFAESPFVNSEGVPTNAG